MHGQTVCRVHGGTSPQARAAAGRRLERQAAEAELATVFGAALSEADPVETVLAEIRHCAGHVAWLRAKVAELPAEDLVWGLTAESVRHGGQGERIVEAKTEARPNLWLVLYGEWADRLARMCSIAARLGIAERHVQLAERLGGLLADTLRGVLDDLDLSEAQRAVAATAVPRHLRLVAGALNEGETAS